MLIWDVEATSGIQGDLEELREKERERERKSERCMYDDIYQEYHFSDWLAIWNIKST